MKILEFPRRGKFCQGPGLKHTSDIFHLLSTQSFIIRSSPHTGGYAWRLQKTNKQTIVCPDVFMMIAKYTDAFSIFDHKKSLVVTRVYFEYDPGSVRHYPLYSKLA